MMLNTIPDKYFLNTHINRNFLTIKYKDIVERKVRNYVTGKHLQSFHHSVHSEDHVTGTYRSTCPFYSIKSLLKTISDEISLFSPGHYICRPIKHA
jgi:hypothetical protein